MKKFLLLFALRTFLWRVALWWCKSLKAERIDAEQFDRLRSGGKNYVVAFWHGSMLAGWFLHRPQERGKISALVSQSKDGEYLSTILEKWKYTMIRGSSHIGGKEAMQLMIDEVANGSSLAITPDGPRGPLHEMKIGAVRTAQQAHVPLIIVGIACENKRVLKSWDRFEVPIPFSRVVAKYSSPIFIPVELNGAPLDEINSEVGQQLRRLIREAEELLSAKGGRS